VVAACLLAAILSRLTIPARRRPLPGLLSEARAVLSDLDGVLVDSSAAIEHTWRGFATRHELDAEAILAAGHGRRAVDLIRLFAPHLDAELEATRIEQEEISLAEGVRALPGALELMESIPPGQLAIVTSGTRAVALARLRSAKLPIPRTLVSADEVDHGKPNPASYLLAAKLLEVDPVHSVVLEDAPAGVEAGRAAGMTVIAVLTTNDESALARAHRLVPDLRALTITAGQ
jgi:sugar-phosphatase